MSGEIRVIGLDPSATNTGIARARVLLPSLEIRIDDIRLVKTESETGKTVRKNSDDLRRAQIILGAFEEAVSEFNPSFFISEIPVGSQNARAAWLLGMTLGCIAGLKVLGMPLIQVQPNDTKMASVGKKTASKPEIIDWAFEKYPDLDWIRHGSSKHPAKLTAANEHLADAIAVIHAGVRSAEFGQAKALMLGMMKNKLVTA